MKNNVFRVLVSILLTAALCTSLAGCSKGTYDDGYEAGFSDALEAAVEYTAVAETEAAVIEKCEEEGFVLITDVIPDAILEVRYYSTFNFVGERIDAYEAPVAYLTKEAAAALKNVFDRRDEITRGVEIVWEAELMRHFTVKLRKL